jgi:chromosome segregation ATPase
MLEVSEATMREFFQSVVDKVAELSTQANRVDELQQMVNQLSARVQEVEAKNYDLQRQLNENQAKTYELQNALDTTKEALDHERSISGGLRETIVTRDSRVTELADNLSREQVAHAVTIRERDEARAEVSDLQRYVADLKSQVAAATERADHWFAVANEHERTAKELQTKLSRIQSMFEAAPSVASVA